MQFYVRGRAIWETTCWWQKNSHVLGKQSIVVRLLIFIVNKAKGQSSYFLWYEEDIDLCHSIMNGYAWSLCIIRVGKIFNLRFEVEKKLTDASVKKYTMYGRSIVIHKKGKQAWRTNNRNHTPVYETGRIKHLLRKVTILNKTNNNRYRNGGQWSN